MENNVHSFSSVSLEFAWVSFIFQREDYEEEKRKNWNNNSCGALENVVK